MTVRWDPETYLRFADERIRPFHELLARVDADPRQIVDLGCGPGQSTPILLARWPDASVAGVDSSPEMVERARESDPDGRIDYVLDDLREWRPDAPVDLLVPAATFQWVPGHLDLLPALADSVAPDGTFALTVPGNFDAPNHVLLRSLPTESRTRRTSRTSIDRLRTTRRPTWLSCLDPAGAWTRGRRPTCTCCRGTTRSFGGWPAPERGRCCRRCPTTSALGSRPTTPQLCAGRTRPRRTGP